MSESTSNCFTALHLPLEVDAVGLTGLAVSKALASWDEVEEEHSPDDDPFDFFTSQQEKPGHSNAFGLKQVNLSCKEVVSEKQREGRMAEEERTNKHGRPEGSVALQMSMVDSTDKFEDETLQPPCTKKLRTEAKDKAATAAASRRRARRKDKAESSREIRPDLWGKYGSKSYALETQLQSEKLPSDSTGYAAKSQKDSEDMGDLFPFVKPSKGLSTGGGHGVESTEESTTVPGPQPIKDLSALDCIADQKVRGVLERLMSQEGFAYKAWDGSASHPILDALKRVVVVLVGMPRGEGYKSAIDEVFKLMDALGGSTSFSEKESRHLRGLFPAINAGISLGPGGKVPMRVSVGKHEDMVQQLLDNEHVQRLASHQDASFKFWHPKLYAHYDNMMVRLRGRMPALRKNFRRSIFSSTAFNFPPNVRTFRHRDVRNLPYGMCAIHALGDFEPKSGGHLILWDLKLIIEFPPGAMVIIPSATVNHSNVPVAPGQKRASITQYTGGSLFRYVDNNFETDIAFQERDAAAFATHSASRRGHWERGLEKWSKFINGKLI